ncbi:MAG: polysaccharide deacetylase family protein [Bacteroidales bacterium]|nr:polysaccharide deacetylase family protein [Bacteroidales bacterium]
MNSHLKLSAVILLTITTLTGKARTIDPNYEVANWKGFCNAAITYTFDDACPNQYSIAIPMLNEFNFDATFFPVINWSPSWSSFQTAVNQGHEVGSHTVSHTDLSTLSSAAQEDELSDSKNQINTNITGQSCLTIAYPFCAPATVSITNQYYIAARHCQGNIESTTPGNFYSISSIICGSLGSVKTTLDFKNKADAAAASSGWAVYLIHGLNTEADGYSPLSSDTLRKSLEYLDAHRNKFWVSTFVNVTRYIKERNNVSVTELEAKEDTVRLQVTDNLDDLIYNYPITIRRVLPQGWSSAIVTQNGQAVSSRIKEISSVGYVEFDVIPDGGNIILSKQIASGIEDLEGKITDKEFRAWTASGDLMFTIPEIPGENLKGQLFDITGKLLRTGNLQNSAGEAVKFSLSDNPVNPGIYLFRVSDATRSWTQQIVF